MAEKTLNDNERKGLPASIDLLSSATSALERKPDDVARMKHLKSVMERVDGEIDAKLAEKAE